MAAANENDEKNSRNLGEEKRKGKSIGEES